MNETLLMDESLKRPVFAIEGQINRVDVKLLIPNNGSDYSAGVGSYSDTETWDLLESLSDIKTQTSCKFTSEDRTMRQYSRIESHTAPNQYRGYL